MENIRIIQPLCAKPAQRPSVPLPRQSPTPSTSTIANALQPKPLQQPILIHSVYPPHHTCHHRLSHHTQGTHLSSPPRNPHAASHPQPHTKTPSRTRHSAAYSQSTASTPPRSPAPAPHDTTLMSWNTRSVDPISDAVLSAVAQEMAAMERIRDSATAIASKTREHTGTNGNDRVAMRVGEPTLVSPQITVISAKTPKTHANNSQSKSSAKPVKSTEKSMKGTDKPLKSFAEWRITCRKTYSRMATSLRRAVARSSAGRAIATATWAQQVGKAQGCFQNQENSQKYEPKSAELSRDVHEPRVGNLESEADTSKSTWGGPDELGLPARICACVRYTGKQGHSQVYPSGSDDSNSGTGALSTGTSSTSAQAAPCVCGAACVWAPEWEAAPERAQWTTDVLTGQAAQPLMHKTARCHDTRSHRHEPRSGTHTHDTVQMRGNACVANRGSGEDGEMHESKENRENFNLETTAGDDEAAIPQKKRNTSLSENVPVPDQVPRPFGWRAPRQNSRTALRALRHQLIDGRPLHRSTRAGGGTGLLSGLSRNNRDTEPESQEKVVEQSVLMDDDKKMTPASRSARGRPLNARGRTTAVVSVKPRVDGLPVVKLRALGNNKHSEKTKKPSSASSKAIGKAALETKSRECDVPTPTTRETRRSVGVLTNDLSWIAQ